MPNKGRPNLSATNENPIGSGREPSTRVGIGRGAKMGGGHRNRGVGPGRN